MKALYDRFAAAWQRADLIARVGIWAVGALLGLWLVSLLWDRHWLAGLLGLIPWAIVARRFWVHQGLHGLIFPDAPAGGHHDTHATHDWLSVRKAPFNHAIKFGPGQGVFVGMVHDNKGKRIPCTLPTEVLHKNHVSLIGASGTGKSKLAGLMLSQLHRGGDAVVAFDPKDDEFLPGVLAEAARASRKEILFINLRQHVPQINPLAGATPDECEQALQAALQLDPSGNPAVDFHRGEDRDACTALISTGAQSIPTLLQEGAKLKAVTTRTNFWREFRTLARLPAFQTEDDARLADVIESGGIIYVVGDTDDLKIVAAQRLLLARILQLIKRRERAGAKQVALFLDEFKYMLSNSALRALGTIRDRRCNLILAYQSFGDLADCGALPPKAVLGAAQGNTTIKVVYKIEDAATAREFVQAAGEERVMVESVSKLVTAEGYEMGSWREDTRNAVTVDMLMTNLPKPLAGEASVGWVFGLGPAFTLSTMHLPAGRPPELRPARQADVPVALASGQDLI